MKEYTEAQVKNINRCKDSCEYGDKGRLFRQLMIWHKLTEQEREKVTHGFFISETAMDNYAQKLIMKYL